MWTEKDEGNEYYELYLLCGNDDDDDDNKMNEGG